MPYGVWRLKCGLSPVTRDSRRALLERIWHVVATVAKAIGADVYDWDSTVHTAPSRMECLGFDGVHPSMQVGTWLSHTLLAANPPVFVQCGLQVLLAAFAQ